MHRPISVVSSVLAWVAAAVSAQAQLPEGFQMTVFAEPPQATYPTGVAAAPTGEVFICRDLNSSLDREPGRGSIVRCVDTDGDGKADEFTTFVESIDSPRSSCFVDGVLYVVAPPYLAAFPDRDGDGVADERIDLVTGLGFDLSFRGADHTSNGVRMGIDGWLYLAIGDYGMLDARGTDGSRVYLRGGGVLRVRPDGTELEVYSSNTRNIYDVAVSPYLDLFSRDNTNDGKGWNTRFHHFTQLADMGYPRLYKNFADEHMKPLADYGGGSGTGALYLHEPGFPEPYGDAVYTCDFTTRHVYVHPMEPFEATFVTGQEPFLPTQAIDMDVDGFSRIYVSNWDGGGYNYSRPDVGRVFQITYPGLPGARFPDLAAASASDLVAHVASRSAVCRLNAQRELLRRGRGEAVTRGLLAIAADDSRPLHARVAAIFTLKQLDGAASHPGLVRLADERPAVREFALRALADRTSESDGVPAEPFVAGLSDPNPRVQLQSVIGLARLGRDDAARAMLPLGIEAGPGAAGTPAGESTTTVTRFLSKKPQKERWSTAIELDLGDASDLYLVALGGHDGNSNDHVAWAEPVLIGPAGEKRLTELEWTSATQGWGSTLVDKDCTGGELRIAGEPVPFGIGTHADSVIAYRIPDGFTKFRVRAGLEDGGTRGGSPSIQFIVTTETPSNLGGAGGTGSPHRAVPHTAIKAVVALKAAEACLEGLDNAELRPVALRCLQEMHLEKAVDGLIARLESSGTDAALARGILGALARLYHVDKVWDGKDWWTTRPDDRGPYYEPIEWELSPRIRAALEAGFARLGADDKAAVLDVFRRNRLDPDAMNLGVEADVITAILAKDPVPTADIATLASAATADDRPAAARIAAFMGLARAQDDATFDAQVATLEAWGRLGWLEEPEFAGAARDFLGSIGHAARIGHVLGFARQAGDDQSKLAWTVALNLAQSPLSDQTVKEAVAEATRTAPRQPGFYLAVADLRLPGFGEQIDAALADDNEELIAAAQLAKKSTAAPEGDAGRKIAELAPEQIAAILPGVSGDAELGEKLFTRQGCSACHAVSQSEPQKGPYLGSVGGKFAREYLVESILNPNAVVAQGFQTHLIQLKDGTTQLGFVTSVEGDEIEVRNIAGIATRVPKDQVASQQELPASMMPPGLAAPLTVFEFASLIDYLGTLKDEQ